MILIPKETELNKTSSIANIIDEKTGVVLPIYFLYGSYSRSHLYSFSRGNYYRKVIGNKEYIINRSDSEDNELFEKLGKANGFTKVEKS